MNYKEIIEQALRMGFQPYAGNESQQQVKVGNLEVSPYFELTGQSEQDGGTPQQMGYTVSTPLSGTRYRTDVVDMNGNVLRSNVHDAGSDQYGLQDMGKLALAALGANYLPGLLGGGEVAGAAPALTGVDAAMADLAASGGLTGSSMATAAPSLLSNAPLSTTLGAPLTELTAGGLLTDVGLPAALSTDAISAGLTSGGASTLASLTPAAADTAQQIVINGSGLKPVVGPGLLTSAVVPGVLATTAAVNTLTGNTSGTTNTTDPANYSNEGRNPTDRANMGPDAKTVPTVDLTTSPLDALKAWAIANPELAKLLFSGAGALLNTVGGPSTSTPGGYVDSGYRPTITAGGWAPSVQARQMAAQPTGMAMEPMRGQANSGLWRYAALGLANQGPALNLPALLPAASPYSAPVVTPSTMSYAMPQQPAASGLLQQTATNSPAGASSAQPQVMRTPVGGANASTISGGAAASTAQKPLYTTLTASSRPQDIAAAYNEFASSRGGNTQANQAEALKYLQNVGVSSGAIDDAYNVYQQTYLAPAGAAARSAPPQNNNAPRRYTSAADIIYRGDPTRQNQYGFDEEAHRLVNFFNPVKDTYLSQNDWDKIYNASDPVAALRSNAQQAVNDPRFYQLLQQTGLFPQADNNFNAVAADLAKQYGGRYDPSMLKLSGLLGG